jgi:serine/threonine-protein kinase RsbW
MRAGQRVHVSASAPAVQEIAAALDAFCAAQRLPPSVAWRLGVVLDEIVSNIIGHGGAVAPARAIDAWFRCDGEVAEVTISDDGPAFDPLTRPDADVTAPLELRQPGGLGIALVKALMDEVRYEWTGRNVLTVRKRIGPEPAAEPTDTRTDAQR